MGDFSYIVTDNHISFDRYRQESYIKEGQVFPFISPTQKRSTFAMFFRKRNKIRETLRDFFSQYIE